ncbi:phosphotransferase enzyme family protein [Paenibacillus sp. SAF-054]|uniref:phosphotransferase enzyme family protein n=1 Tax=unclassified Paenibacillus TaxID=185978 RepID=UPI003F7D9128
MNEAFGADTEDSRRLLLVQAEAALTSALERYELQEKEIAFIQVSEHVTYRIEDETGKSYLLRIHPGSADPGEINSEMLWLDHLAGRWEMVVPTGVANQDGSCVTEVEADRGSRFYVSVLHWVEGSHFEDGLSEGQIRQMGILLAQMHRAAQAFQPAEGFSRPVWEAEAFEQEVGRLKKHYRSYLTADEFRLYEQAAGRIVDHMSEMDKNPGTYGMIHADFHEGNLVFRDGKPYPIDFGRCGFGYYAYDLAQAFIGLYPVQRQQFLDGYESLLPLPSGPDRMRMLETFFIKALIENQSYHAPHPWEAAELRESKPYSVALVRHYLDSKPFLFGAIPV